MLSLKIGIKLIHEQRKGVVMLHIIGNGTSQETFRAGSYGIGNKKDMIIQEAIPKRETRLMEMLNAGEGADSKDCANEPTRNRTKLEGGEIIIETYTEDGKLVKITPPGYLPFDKIV